MRVMNPHSRARHQEAMSVAASRPTRATRLRPLARSCHKWNGVAKSSQHEGRHRRRTASIGTNGTGIRIPPVNATANLAGWCREGKYKRTKPRGILPQGLREETRPFAFAWAPSVRAAQVNPQIHPQIGIASVWASVVARAVQVIAIQCVGGLHASALLAWPMVKGTEVSKQRMCQNGVRIFLVPT